MQTRCVQIANTVFHSCHQCDNVDRLNKYKQQITNNLQLYSCARSQHAHANWVNWLNIITICISLHDSYNLENNGPKSCYLSLKFVCRIDKYRADERTTMMIGVVLIYFVRNNDEDFCMMLL